MDSELDRFTQDEPGPKLMSLYTLLWTRKMRCLAPKQGRHTTLTFGFQIGTRAVAMSATDCVIFGVKFAKPQTRAYPKRWDQVVERVSAAKRKAKTLGRSYFFPNTMRYKACAASEVGARNAQG